MKIKHHCKIHLNLTLTKIKKMIAIRYQCDKSKHRNTQILITQIEKYSNVSQLRYKILKCIITQIENTQMYYNLENTQMYHNLHKKLK